MAAPGRGVPSSSASDERTRLVSLLAPRTTRTSKTPRALCRAVTRQAGVVVGDLAKPIPAWSPTLQLGASPLDC